MQAKGTSGMRKLADLEERIGQHGYDRPLYTSQHEDRYTMRIYQLTYADVTPYTAFMESDLDQGN